MPLRLKSRDDRLREAVYGIALPPTVVPARTTLRVVELEMDGALALTPDGRRVYVLRETIRDHGYIPRRAAPGLARPAAEPGTSERTGGSMPDSQEGMCGGRP